MGETFKLNEPQVACESLESDLILLNFETGFYYSVRGVGADICQFVLAGGRVSTAVNEIASRYNIPREQVQMDANAFIEDLLNERLIVPVESSVVQAQFNTSAASYLPPKCEKFDDMADQLLLDKIDDQSKDAQWSQAAV